MIVSVGKLADAIPNFLLKAKRFFFLNLLTEYSTQRQNVGIDYLNPRPFDVKF